MEPHTMRIPHRFYLLIIILLLHTPLHARGYEGWTVTNFNNENGLPQNSIHFIEMDKDGYLWMATQGGIVRYDGRRFRLFDNSNSPLLNNRYRAFGKADDGYIYCMDAALQTSFYSNKTGFSKPVPMSGMAPTADGGLIDINRLDIAKMAPFINSFTHGAPPDAASFVYYATGKDKGFLVWSYGIAGYVSNGKVQRVDTITFYSNLHLSISAVGDKLCYVGKNGDFVLVDSNGVHSHQKIPFAVPWEKVKLHATTVAFFRQGDQVFFNLDGDIYEVRLAGGELEFHYLIVAKDISSIACIRYYPEQGLLVIGSTTQGLFLFKKQQLASVGKNRWSAQNAFYALAPYGRDQVVATTGILPHSPPVPRVNEATNRFCILRDRKGHYWYTSGNTLLETDDRFRVLKSVPILTAGTVCIQEDDQGTIWLAQGHRDFGRIQGDTLQRYQLDSLEGKGITTINNFIPAGDQAFWLVGYHLCMRLDVKHHRQRIYHEFDDIELRTAYIDKRGNLWLGSYGQGYYLFLNGRFVKMPEDKMHALGVVHCFLEDNKGSIWMTTNNGLFQCAVNDLYDYAAGRTTQVYHHYYGKESGLKTSEFNGGCTPSGLMLENGSFAFPSMDGVVRFYPDSVKPLLPDGKIFIEQVLLDGAPVNDRNLSRISPSFKRLELIVSTPYFGNPRNLRIQYNIAGLDDRWYPLDENDHIVLNRLKYGHYTLRLRKEAGFGTGNYTTTELKLVVAPFFYQTWWFRVLAGMCLALLTVLFIRVRYRYLIRQRNRLEAEVKDRTSALVYSNKLLEKLTVMIAHDLKSPLHFLSKVTGHLRSNVQQENLQGIERTSSELKHTADQAYQFVEEFSLWMSSFNESFSIKKTTFVLNELLQELELFFKEMLEANGNKLFVGTANRCIVETDRDLLKVILRNIIDNANKHGRGCDIDVSVRAVTGQNVAITIADTGEGMSEPVLQRIHDRIAQASTAAGIERNSRFGYQMIIDFATRLAAKLEVQSEKGKGTSVTLYVQGKVSETNQSAGSAEQVVSPG